LSYPQDWFALQMRLYARYHQKDPESFYQQNETLEFSLMDGKPVKPYDLPQMPKSSQKYL
jgi:uncharacterized membrane protein (UPF0182 family)